MGTNTTFLVTHLTCKLAFLYLLYNLANLYARAFLTFNHHYVYHRSDSNLLELELDSLLNAWNIDFERNYTTKSHDQTHSCYIPPPITNRQGQEVMAQLLLLWVGFTALAVVFRRMVWKTPLMAKDYKTSFYCLSTAISVHALDALVSTLRPLIYQAARSAAWKTAMQHHIWRVCGALCAVWNPMMITGYKNGFYSLLAAAALHGFDVLVSRLGPGIWEGACTAWKTALWPQMLGTSNALNGMFRTMVWPRVCWLLLGIQGMCRTVMWPRIHWLLFGLWQLGEFSNWNFVWWAVWLAVWWKWGIWPLPSLDQGGEKDIPAVAGEG